MKIGSIVQWTSNTIPDGFLLCDGSAVSRTTYADLFSVIGTTYGAGDSTTTFNLPDLRGRVGVGKSSDTEFDTLGESGGSKYLQEHTHKTGIQLSTYGAGPSGNDTMRVTYTQDGLDSASSGTGNSGNLQPYLVTNYIIKALNPDSIKISELDSASAITSSDVLPIVQDGETKKINVLDMIYPIGSIYMSVSSTNPSTFFGGTWTAWGSGRVPVGVDTNDSDFDTVEETGGAKTHTLTENEMPAHNHGEYLNDNYGNRMPYALSYGGGVEVETGYYVSTGYVSLATNNRNVVTAGAGGSQPHNNLQPYITCYMWKRTA